MRIYLNNDGLIEDDGHIQVLKMAKIDLETKEYRKDKNTGEIIYYTESNASSLERAIRRYIQIKLAREQQDTNLGGILNAILRIEDQIVIKIEGMIDENIKSV